MTKHDSQTGSLLGQKPRNHVLRYWIWEILALLLTVTFLAVIAVILSKYNNKAFSELPSGINLATLVALLSTLLRLSMGIVIAEVISQAKWNWFARQPRRVIEFQTFDHASRGAIGSLKLIGLLQLGFRGSPLAVIAALTTVLSLAIEPFAQQAIKTTTCSRMAQDAVASIPMAHTFPTPGSILQTSDSASDVGSGMKSALLNGLVTPPTSSNTIQPSCSTQNCTFGAMGGVSDSTIGMCSRCFDTTNFTKVMLTQDVVGTVNLTFDDLWISLGAGLPWLATGGSNLSFNQADIPQNLRELAAQSFANISVLVASQSPCIGKNGTCPHTTTSKGSEFHGFDYTAATCVLFPCMEDISSKMESGRFEEVVVNTTPAKIVGSKFQSNTINANDSRLAVKTPCRIDGNLYTIGNFSLITSNETVPVIKDVEIDGKNMSVPAECVYQVDGNYALAMQRHLETDVFSGSCLRRSGALSEDTSSTLDCEQDWWLQNLYAGGNATFASLQNSFDSLATSATNFIRENGQGPMVDAKENAAGPAEAHGVAFESTLCIQVQWLWLLLPAILSFNTIALLTLMLITSYMSRSQHVWKSSQLPLLFFGLDARAEQSSPGSRGSNDLNSLKKASEKIKITMGTSEYNTSQSYLVTRSHSEPEDGQAHPPREFAPPRLTTESLYERIYAPGIAEREALRNAQTVVMANEPANMPATSTLPRIDVDGLDEEVVREGPYIVSPPSSPI